VCRGENYSNSKSVQRLYKSLMALYSAQGELERERFEGWEVLNGCVRINFILLLYMALHFTAFRPQIRQIRLNV